MTRPSPKEYFSNSKASQFLSSDSLSYSKTNLRLPGHRIRQMLLGLKKYKKGGNEEAEYALYHLCSESPASASSSGARRQDHHHRSTRRRDAKEVCEVMVQNRDIRAEDH